MLLYRLFFGFVKFSTTKVVMFLEHNKQKPKNLRQNFRLSVLCRTKDGWAVEAGRALRLKFIENCRMVDNFTCLWLAVQKRPYWSQSRIVFCCSQLFLGCSCCLIDHLFGRDARYMSS